jgi:hypothetical protein
VTMDEMPASTVEGIEWMPVEEFLIGPEAGAVPAAMMS